MARPPKQAVVETHSTTVLGKSLFQRIAGYLDENDWNYSAHEDKSYFDFRCRLDDTSVRVIIDVFESNDWQRVLVYSVFPVFAPAIRRSAMAESLTRINYGVLAARRPRQSASNITASRKLKLISPRLLMTPSWGDGLSGVTRRPLIW